MTSRKALSHIDLKEDFLLKKTKREAFLIEVLKGYFPIEDPNFFYIKPLIRNYLHKGLPLYRPQMTFSVIEDHKRDLLLYKSSRDVFQ